jgi:serine/threonine-protein kinase
MSEEPSLAGTQLGDRYDVLELIGRGGMGAVYRARDRELDEIVALKVIRPELASDPGIVERFRREVKLARRVTHKNVARTFELGSAGGHLFCTMELVEGESLTQRLAREKRLPVGDAAAVACALCDALEAAHAVDVIHRDIKPDNVLLASDGRVVMADFGVAAIHTGEGDLSGTPAYMAPEQAAGESPTPAADIYAVGLVLFEMLTGHRAFQGATPQILADKRAFDRIAPGPGDAPPELAEIIGRATARERSARVASAQELHRALEPFARTGRRETVPPRESIGADLATVIVLSPRGTGKMYIAEAVYDELLAMLTREPRLRVLSRDDANEPGAVRLHLEVGEMLVARAERDGTVLVAIETPLAIDQVGMAAEAVVRGVVKFTAPRAAALDPRELEAIDLMLQARHHKRDVSRGSLAVEKATRAYELCPTNPRVLATLAIVTVRRAFFAGQGSDDVMARAAEHARAAVAAAPELFDSHLALGHVEFNSGNPVAAARSYRTAIARSPHCAEAHEYMGRMLLEAGYVEQALARLDEALAISRDRRGMMWEVARGYALEGRWAEHDEVAKQMRELDIQRPFALTRVALWRRVPDVANEVLPELKRLAQSFAPGLMEALVEVYVGKPWPAARDKLVVLAGVPWPNRRRRAWVAQVVAEACGWVGDVETCASVIGHAIGDGLFDLHWLDKCPLLDGLRASPRCAGLRAPIQRRAQGILDAMYGDHELGTSDTAMATS